MTISNSNQLLEFIKLTDIMRTLPVSLQLSWIAARIVSVQEEQSISKDALMAQLMEAIKVQETIAIMSDDGITSMIQ